MPSPINIDWARDNSSLSLLQIYEFNPVSFLSKTYTNNATILRTNTITIKTNNIIVPHINIKLMAKYNIPLITKTHIPLIY
jgi:hypothetical protein